MSALREPLIHTGITDVLPDDHPLAWTTVYCDGPGVCGTMLHAGNNENMRGWVESGCGNYCLRCFARVEEEREPEQYALPGGDDGT